MLYFFCNIIKCFPIFLNKSSNLSNNNGNNFCFNIFLNQSNKTLVKFGIITSFKPVFIPSCKQVEQIFFNIFLPNVKFVWFEFNDIKLLLFLLLLFL